MRHSEVVSSQLAAFSVWKGVFSSNALRVHHPYPCATTGSSKRMYTNTPPSHHHTICSDGSGGGLAVIQSSTVVAVNASFTSCSSFEDGGGAFVKNSLLNCTGCLFSACLTGTHNHYRHHYVPPAPTLSAVPCVCLGWNGGGLATVDSSAVQAVNVDFTACSGNDSGGGVFVDSLASFDCSGCVFSDCSAGTRHQLTAPATMLLSFYDPRSRAALIVF